MNHPKRENFSMKRSAILKVLQNTTVHPTADWVYHQLKPKYPNISLGTVYRNLKKFCETGKAVSIGVINGQEHFDGDISAHAHMICECCGSILDIDGTFIEEKQLHSVYHDCGHQITTAQIVFRGTCKDCMEATEENEEIPMIS